LIEEKIGVGSAGIYPDIRCARCVNVAPVARNVSGHDATKPQRSQRLFIIAPAVYRE
jgi:L-lactate utilization protein LutB